MTDTNDAVAAFLARGGEIKKVRTGAATYTDRQLLDATRGEGDAYKGNRSRMYGADIADDIVAEQRSERLREVVCEAALMGGHEAAMDALNDFNGHTRASRKPRGRRNQAAQDRYNAEWGVNY